MRGSPKNPVGCVKRNADAPSGGVVRGRVGAALNAPHGYLILALIAALCLVLASPVHAQEARDDALDSLLEKLSEPADKKADEPKDGDTKDDAKPADEKTEDAEKENEKDKAKVSDEDKALDDLLEQLGATKDEPTPDDRPKQPGGSGEGERPQEPPPSGADAQDDDRDQQERQDRGLDDADRRLDERLEELTGRKRKRKQSESGRGQGEGSGPMGQIIKEMREIEKRLGEPDTGDETRGKQKQIVQRLETLIEQLRQAQGGSGQGSRELRQAGRRPGDQQQGDQTGTNPGGAPLSKPARPPADRVAAGGKDEWGHLPEDLRREMENVFKEDSLPIYQDLIRRYYLSVSRGKTNRGD